MKNVSKSEIKDRLDKYHSDILANLNNLRQFALDQIELNKEINYLNSSSLKNSTNQFNDDNSNAEIFKPPSRKSSHSHYFNSRIDPLIQIDTRYPITPDHQIKYNYTVKSKSGAKKFKSRKELTISEISAVISPKNIKRKRKNKSIYNKNSKDDPNSKKIQVYPHFIDTFDDIYQYDHEDKLREQNFHYFKNFQLKSLYFDIWNNKWKRRNIHTIKLDLEYFKKLNKTLKQREKIIPEEEVAREINRLRKKKSKIQSLGFLNFNTSNFSDLNDSSHSSQTINFVQSQSSLESDIDAEFQTPPIYDSQNESDGPPLFMRNRLSYYQLKIGNNSEKNEKNDPPLIFEDSSENERFFAAINCNANLKENDIFNSTKDKNNILDIEDNSNLCNKNNETKNENKQKSNQLIESDSNSDSHHTNSNENFKDEKQNEEEISQSVKSPVNKIIEEEEEDNDIFDFINNSEKSENENGNNKSNENKINSELKTKPDKNSLIEDTKKDIVSIEISEESKKSYQQSEKEEYEYKNKKQISSQNSEKIEQSKQEPETESEKSVNSKKSRKSSNQSNSDEKSSKSNQRKPNKSNSKEKLDQNSDNFDKSSKHSGNSSKSNISEKLGQHTEKSDKSNKQLEKSNSIIESDKSDQKNQLKDISSKSTSKSDLLIKIPSSGEDFFLNDYENNPHFSSSNSENGSKSPRNKRKGKTTNDEDQNEFNSSQFSNSEEIADESQPFEEITISELCEIEAETSSRPKSDFESKSGQQQNQNENKQQTKKSKILEEEEEKEGAEDYFLFSKGDSNQNQADYQKQQKYLHNEEEETKNESKTINYNKKVFSDEEEKEIKDKSIQISHNDEIFFEEEEKVENKFDQDSHHDEITFEEEEEEIEKQEQNFQEKHSASSSSSIKQKQHKDSFLEEEEIEKQKQVFKEKHSVSSSSSKKQAQKQKQHKDSFFENEEEEIKKQKQVFKEKHSASSSSSRKQKQHKYDFFEEEEIEKQNYLKNISSLIKKEQKLNHKNIFNKNDKEEKQKQNYNYHKNISSESQRNEIKIQNSNEEKTSFEEEEEEFEDNEFLNDSEKLFPDGHRIIHNSENPIFTSTFDEKKYKRKEKVEPLSKEQSRIIFGRLVDFYDSEDDYDEKDDLYNDGKKPNWFRKFDSNSSTDKSFEIFEIPNRRRKIKNSSSDDAIVIHIADPEYDE